VLFIFLVYPPLPTPTVSCSLALSLSLLFHHTCYIIPSRPQLHQQTRRLSAPVYRQAIPHIYMVEIRYSQSKHASPPRTISTFLLWPPPPLPSKPLTFLLKHRLAQQKKFVTIINPHICDDSSSHHSFICICFASKYHSLC